MRVSPINHANKHCLALSQSISRSCVCPALVPVVDDGADGAAARAAGRGRHRGRASQRVAVVHATCVSQAVTGMAGTTLAIAVLTR